MEHVFKLAEGRTWRPFSESAGVRCRGYSLLLQRRLTDVGSEQSFARAAEQVKEHDGFEISPTTLRNVSEAHGQALHAHPKFRQGAAAREPKAQIIVAADGTMIPVVTMDSTQIDQRKTRKTSWKEARLALAYEPGAIGPIFAATTGSPKQTGEQLTRCALRIGWDEHTHIHGRRRWCALDCRPGGVYLGGAGKVAHRLLSFGRRSGECQQELFLRPRCLV